MSTLPEGWSYGENPKDGFIYRWGDGVWLIEQSDRIFRGDIEWENEHGVTESRDGFYYRRPWPPAAVKESLTAPALLKQAADTMEQRGKQYDSPEGERSMGRAVTAFNSITGRDLSEAEGWLLLQILKDVRQWQRPDYHEDSGVDCVAYAALKAEAKAKEGKS